VPTNGLADRFYAEAGPSLWRQPLLPTGLHFPGIAMKNFEILNELLNERCLVAIDPPKYQKHVSGLLCTFKAGLPTGWG
jgi:hypothetical protein